MDVKILVLRFADYCSFIKGLSPETVFRYKEVLRYFFQIIHIENVDEITQEKVREFFYYGRTVKQWKASTFIAHRVALHVFMDWCVREKYIKENPVKDIEIPKMDKKLPTKLTKQESLRLLEVIYNYPYEYKFLRARNHAIFSMFLFAGLRKGELIKLRFTDVDLENMSLFVNCGKGSKDRVIPISYSLAESLKRYLEERKRLNKTCPEFFASLNRNMGFTYSGIRNLVEILQKASGIKFTVHKLRHTFATLMLEGGCDIYSLSKMMGHSDIKTTTIYLYASVEHLRSQITKHPLND